MTIYVCGDAPPNKIHVLLRAYCKYFQLTYSRCSMNFHSWTKVEFAGMTRRDRGWPRLLSNCSKCTPAQTASPSPLKHLIAPTTDVT